MPPRIWIELDSSAFNHNARTIKQLVGGKLLAAVIKGNGYGHGLIEIATLCEQNKNIDFLCVAYLSEALLLRKHTITKPILVLSYIDEDIIKSINKNISFMLDSHEVAQQLEQVAKQYNCIFNVHVKIDTGLSRHGVTAENALEFLQALLQYNYIHIEGVYSHFVQSHLEDQTITNQQKIAFEKVISSITNKQNIYIHMSNSASLLAGTAPHICNFFRVGLSLYGLWPSEYVKKANNQNITLQPVLSLKTHILQIKHVPADTSIGYNHMYTTTRDSTIVILPVGYADGIPSSLSNNGYMIINNQRAPIVGKIAMNTCFLDATNNKGIILNNVVEIIGKKISAQECADTAQIQNIREFLTGIKEDIPKNII